MPISVETQIKQVAFVDQAPLTVPHRLPKQPVREIGTDRLRSVGRSDDELARRSLLLRIKEMLLQFGMKIDLPADFRFLAGLFATMRRDESGNEIDVGPAKAQDLPAPHARVGGDRMQQKRQRILSSFTN